MPLSNCYRSAKTYFINEVLVTGMAAHYKSAGGFQQFQQSQR